MKDLSLGFYAFDHAAGDALRIVAEEAKSRGHHTVNPQKQMPVSDEGMAALIMCDAVVLGLSSFQTEMEINLLKALPKATRVFILEDVPEAARRPKFREYVNRVVLVFSAHDLYRSSIHDFGYDGSVYLGPPPQWRAEYEGVMAAKTGNARSEIGSFNYGGDSYVLDSSVKIVGTILGKDPIENNRILVILAEAIRGNNILLAISQHPGEKATKPEDEEKFQKAFAERKEILKGVWLFDSGWKGSKLAGAVDVLFSGSASNITIASAYARVPQVWLNDKGVRERMRAQTGKETWFVPALGGALVSFGGDLKKVINTALSEGGRTYLLNKQEQNFPLPDDWHTEKKIVDFLEKIV